MFPCSEQGGSRRRAVPEIQVISMTAHRDGALDLTLRNLGTVPAQFDLPEPMDGMTVVTLSGPRLPVTLAPTHRDVALRLAFRAGRCTDPTGIALLPDSSRLLPRGLANVSQWDTVPIAAAVAAAVARACR